MSLRRLASAIAIVLTFAALAASQVHAQTYIDEAIEIEGEVQLPSVQIFISRQNLNEDYELELDESFLPKIVESIEKKPF